MFTSLFALASLAAMGLATPVIQQRELKDVSCGTTGDATFSDCQALVNDPAIWNAAYNLDNTCTFTNVLANRYIYPAKNLACHGNCCVFYTDHAGGGWDTTIDFVGKEQSRLEAQQLLGCGDPASDKINVLGKFDWHYLCMSNGKGCGDCFDDADFAF